MYRFLIATKDQSGGIYNSYSTSGQRFMAVINKPRPQTWTQSVYCHKSLALCYNYILMQHYISTSNANIALMLSANKFQIVMQNVLVCEISSFKLYRHIYVIMFVMMTFNIFLKPCIQNKKRDLEQKLEQSKKDQQAKVNMKSVCSEWNYTASKRKEPLEPPGFFYRTDSSSLSVTTVLSSKGLPGEPTSPSQWSQCHLSEVEHPEHHTHSYNNTMTLASWPCVKLYLRLRDTVESA